MTTETTTAFRFELENKPGRLREVTQRLAKQDVNIDGIGGIAGGESGTIQIVPDQPGTAARALESTDLDFEEVETVIAEVPDEPGQLDERLQTLAAKGINVEALFPVSGAPSRLAFAVDDPDRARDLL